MSHATTTATARSEEPTTMATTPDLFDHPTVRQVRAELARTRQHLERPEAAEDSRRARVGRALHTLAQAMDHDPTLALDPHTPRWVDLLAELVRQLGPLTCQADLVAQAQRLEDEAGLTEIERRRALARIGKTNPTAPQQAERVTTRIEEITAQLRAQTVQEWDTPQRRRALAEPHLDRRALAEAAALLRRAVADAQAIAPDLPEVAAVLAAATAAEQATTPATTPVCTAPECGQPLPPADPGRARRYCSPSCRTRTRRRGAKR